jgi:hypothetical protein
VCLGHTQIYYIDLSGPPAPPPPPPPTPAAGISKPHIPTAPAPPLIIPSLRKEIRHYPQVKLKNFQWKRMDAGTAEKTIWKMEDNTEEDDLSMEKALKEHGAFEKIEALFPAKVNTFLEKRLAAQNNLKADIKNDAINFLSKDKNRNISTYLYVTLGI